MDAPEDDIICLTLVGGKPFFVRRMNVIAAHKAIPGETTTPHATKAYLSSGITVYVKEEPEECVL